MGAITANHLAYYYGQTPAITDVSLQIRAGEQVAIMGPSGCGKSTLLHCLAGILVPDTGTVYLDNEQISALPDRERAHRRLTQMGFVFQDGQLLAELTALDNVAIPLLLAGVHRRHAYALAQQWLQRLGIGAIANQRPGEMSGGQMQRVAVARALAPQPRVIFTDEPTGALDQVSGHQVMQLLSSSCAQNGTTLVLVTHDLGVAQWCGRLVEMRDGQIHADSAQAPAAPQGVQ